MSGASSCVRWGEASIRYETVRLPDRRTLTIEVHPEGRVVVRAPVDCGAEVIAQRVRRRAAWILRQLRDFARYQPRTPARRYVSGESHRYLGRQYRLKVVGGIAPGVRVKDGRLVVGVPGHATPEGVRAALESWFRRRARATFEEILAVSLDRFETPRIPRLVVRTMRSRWGSYSPGGTLTLNPRLIHAPRACIEYVVVHELCHMSHRNHDAAFHRLLERILPDWRRSKNRLEQALL